MALRDQPYFPLYVQDYLTDENLNMCSWATQGIYIKILCVLHKQKEYGTILFKQTVKQNSSTCLDFASVLIKHLPCQLSEMEIALQELVDNEVLIIDGDKLYQKRMVKDGKTSEARSKAGKKGGGNPILFKQNSKQKVKQTVKQNPENENDIVYNKDTNSINDENTISTIEVDISNLPNEIKWKKDYEVYLLYLEQEYEKLINDPNFIATQEKFNPGVDILLSLEKALTNFWATEAGWANKKRAKTKKIDWKATLTRALSLKENKVYKEQYGTKRNATQDRIANTAAQLLDRYKQKTQQRQIGVSTETGGDFPY